MRTRVRRSQETVTQQPIVIAVSSHLAGPDDAGNFVLATFCAVMENSVSESFATTMHFSSAMALFFPVLRRTSTWLALSLLVGAPFLQAAPGAAAITRSAKPRRHHVAASRYHWRVKWNPLFPGSHDMLVHQNEELDRLQLPRFAGEYDLAQYEIQHDLVPVAETDALKLAANLPDNRRYCRPWTRDFLNDFTQAFYNEFHAPLQVNSLVRTMEQQHKLRRHNRYAAPEFGDTASTHLTGVALDLSRRGLTPMQYAWIRAYLLPLKEQGLVDPIEERQPVLHIVVFEKYGGLGDDAQKWSEANEPTDMPAQSAAGPFTAVEPASVPGASAIGGSQP